MPSTVGVEVPARDREVLISWTRSQSIRAGLARRARSGPPRCCRCSPGSPKSAATTTSDTAPPTLFVALEVATGKVTDACYSRHRHEEFLRLPRCKPDPRTWFRRH